MNSFDPSLQRFLQNPRETIREIDRVRCERSLKAFVEHHWSILEPNTEFVDGWALDAVCEHLEAISYGQITRLLMNVPPGFMKSLLTDVFWPAWEWSALGMPHLRYVAFSYAASLTERDNRRFLDLVRHPRFLGLWGDRFALKKQGEVLVSNDKMGWKLATSIGGVGTGERGDRIVCLPYEERILTSCGWLPIGRIVDQRLDVSVAGLSSEGSVEWQKIEEYETNPGRDLVRIDYVGGSLVCTADHLVYVEGRGYIQAQHLKVGENVKSLSIDTVPELRHDNLGQTEPHREPEILFAGVSDRCRAPDIEGREQSAVHRLRHDGVSAAGASRTFGGDILLARLSREAQPWRKQSCLSGWPGKSCVRVLWEGLFGSRRSSATGSDLFPFLRHSVALARKCVPGSFAGAESVMRRVWERVQAAREYQSGGQVLLASVCGETTFAAHGGERQRTVRSWGGDATVSAWLDANIQGGHSGARWQLLPSVRSSGPDRRAGASRASYRLCEDELGRVESDHGMPVLSREDARRSTAAGRVANATILAVSPAGHVGTTYNVRVAPHHNYFAEGILVHNCDDPHSVKESESDAVRGETVRWFKEAMSNRLNNMETSAVVVIMQRVHESDVSGEIIERATDYEHLMIPMEWDGRRYTTSIGWTDPRTEIGELAWPERFSARVVNGLKSTMGPYAYAAQYQQMPSPRGGGIFQRGWWQSWDEAIAAKYDCVVPAFTRAGVPVIDAETGLQERAIKFPPFEYIVGSVDTAYTEKQENDYSAMTVWGVWRDAYDLPKLMLITAWRDRLPLHELVEKIAYTCRRYKVDNLLVEGKASGISVSQELRRLHTGGGWGIQMVNPGAQDKVARAHSVAHVFADEMVYAPEKDWADMVITEAASFPKAPHDDLVDSMVQALRHLRDGGMLLHGSEVAEELGSALAYRPATTKPLYPS